KADEHRHRGQSPAQKHRYHERSRNKTSSHNNNEHGQTRTRRVLFIARPSTEILHLVGPLQVFVRAAELFGRQNPGSPPIYSREVITTSRQTSVVTNCGLRIAAHNTFRRVRGEIDTLLIAGGSAIENDEIGS